MQMTIILWTEKNGVWFYISNSNTSLLSIVTQQITITDLSFHLQFFKDVFLRMFVMQNPEYEFKSAYLRCVEQKMDELKPFGMFVYFCAVRYFAWYSNDSNF